MSLHFLSGKTGDQLRPGALRVQLDPELDVLSAAPPAGSDQRVWSVSSLCCSLSRRALCPDSASRGEQRVARGSVPRGQVGIHMGSGTRVCFPEDKASVIINQRGLGGLSAERKLPFLLTLSPVIRRKGWEGGAFFPLREALIWWAASFSKCPPSFAPQAPYQIGGRPGNEPQTNRSFKYSVLLGK